MNGFEEKKYRKIIIRNIKDYLNRKGMNHNQLAEQLGVAASTMAGWLNEDTSPHPPSMYIAKICDIFEITPNDLFADASSQTQAETEHQVHIHSVNGIRWFEIAGLLPNNQKKLVDLGIEFFKKLIVENLDGEEYTEASGRSWAELENAWLIALRTGQWRLVSIPRDKKKESNLKKKFREFGLKKACVAQLEHYYDGSPIRAELVAFLATQALSELEDATQSVPGRIGIGSGYTMLRFAELFSDNRFIKTKWIPLLEFNTSDSQTHSAKDVARTLALRFNGTANTPNFDDIWVKNTVSQIHEVETMIFSCGGWGRRHRTEKEARPGMQFWASDYNVEYPFLKKIYDGLSQDDKVNFAGEILCYPLLQNGHIAGGEGTRAILGENVSQVDLDVIKNLVYRGGNSIIVASQRYKAKAVEVAIKQKLVNCIVIDSEIADLLI